MSQRCNPQKNDLLISCSGSVGPIAVVDDKNKYADVNICITLIKRKLLDLAIRGKLIPQDQDDEPVSVLLKHIREEKEKLIKAGKIKRDKKESIIFRGADSSYYMVYP